MKKLVLWIHRQIPDYARQMLILLAFFQIFAYYFPRIVGVGEYLDFSLPLDGRIPLIPAFSYVYILAYVFWTVNYILIARQGREVCVRLFAADMFSKAVCIVCFFAIPSTIAQPPREEITGLGAWLLRIVYSMDEPDNLLPSMHCYLSYLAWRPMLNAEVRKGIPVGYRVFSLAAALLVCLSTLFTRQHVVLDFVTGVALAEIAWQLARLVRFPVRNGDV